MAHVSNAQSLTARQQEALGVITEHVSEHGRPPTLRELAASMHVNSTNTVRFFLGALEREGYIKRDSGARGIQVLRAA